MPKEVKASLKTYRQSPRKVRLLADLVRGKLAKRSLAVLKFTNKKGTGPIEKLIRSALSNAEVNKGINEDMIISKIEVNEGPTLKRMRPRARGRASRINKRTSHVTLTLTETKQKTTN